MVDLMKTLAAGAPFTGLLLAYGAYGEQALLWAFGTLLMICLTMALGSVVRLLWDLLP